MATRARIGVLRTPDNVESIYSHWDGYPEGVGATLAESYTQSTKVDSLMALGDVSILGSEIGEQHDFELRSNNPGSKDWCLAYGRDRGETDVSSSTHSLSEWPDCDQEYEYLFDPAKGWAVREAAFGDVQASAWTPLKP